MEKQLCTKIIYCDEKRQSHVLLGLVLREDEHFLTIRTRRGEITLNRRFIVTILETDQKFEGEADGYMYS